MKRILFLFVIVALILASCAPVPTPTVVVGPKTNLDWQGGKPIRVILPAIWHPVHRQMLAGYLAACRDLKLYCEPLTVGDATTEEYLALFEKAASLGSSGVVANFGGPILYQPGIDLVKAGIPTISAHGQMDPASIPGLTAWIAADSSAFAKVAAKEMADRLSCKGKVAVTQGGLSDQENAVGNGFTAELKRLCPGITVLGIQQELGEPTQATAVNAAIFAANPDLTGAFSTTGGGSTSWSTALKNAGKRPGDVVIISMDTTIPNLDLVKAGWVYALVAQPLYNEFYRAVELLLAKIKGETVTYANPIPAPIVKAADLDFYYKQNSDAGIK